MTIVEILYKEYLSILTYLDSKNETSLKSSADSNLKKNLIVCSASYFEVEITESLSNYFLAKSNSIAIKEFLQNKALKRQYHSLFDWENNSANPFFSLFGQGFKSFMTKKIQEDKKLLPSINSFLEIGRERNRLAHLNFGNYTVEKTLNEIYNSYEDAKFFVENIIKNIEEYNNPR